MNLSPSKLYSPPPPDLFTPYPTSSLSIPSFLRSQRLLNLSPSSPSNPFSFNRKSRSEFKTFPHLKLPHYDQGNDVHLKPLKYRKVGKVKTEEGTWFNVEAYLVEGKGGRRRLPKTERFRDYVDKRIGRRRGRKIKELRKGVKQIHVQNQTQEKQEDKVEGEVEVDGDEEVEIIKLPGPSPTAPPVVVPERSLSITRELLHSLPTPIFAHVLSYMPTWTMFDTILTSCVTSKTEEQGKRMNEIRASLRQSKAFEKHWDVCVRRHRIVRSEALNRGDMDVDVEGSAYPSEMGEVDQDVPVWKRCFDAEDFCRIEKSDEVIRARHVEWLRIFSDMCYGRGGRGAENMDFVSFSEGYEEEGVGEEVKEEVKEEGGQENLAEVELTEVDTEEARLMNLAITETPTSATAAKEKGKGKGTKQRSLQFPPFACFEIIGAGLALGAAVKAVVNMPAEKRSRVRSLNLDGCLTLTEGSFVELLSVLPNLMSLRCSGLTCIGEEGCAAIGRCKRLRYLDLSNANMSDGGVKAMTEEMKANGIESLKKLSVANAGGLTDEGVKQIGATVAATLEDFCMAGCFKVTDLGLMLVSFPKLKRLNYCGSYKITDASRRYILSQNPTLLIYNGVRQFGILAGHALTASKLAQNARMGTFYDSSDEEELVGREKNEEEKYDDFKRQVGM
ncbi:hypothetical protein TrVE_jg12912 [Triparma verrucosa]|uniref:Uncharacterized protein n=1 Tax=Triparma verrucosa TaxID=1606542 RepID=A0A9W7C1L3_9STRA|nr:hypothetical protein TrVE_jg12912 [Triparma verrucosa]